MKKVVVALAILVANLFSGEFSMYDFINANIDMKQERQLETKSDYKELESVLKNAVKHGDFIKAIALGSLYESEWKLKDGVIKPNIRAAKENYEIASKKGVAFATFKLGILALKESKFDDALDFFWKASHQKGDKASSVAGVAYGSLVLDKYSLDISKLLLGTEILRPIAQKSNLPTAYFVLAHLYNALGIHNEADKYLTKACMAKNAPKQIVDYCFGNDVELFYNGKKLEKKINDFDSSCNVK